MMGDYRVTLWLCALLALVSCNKLNQIHTNAVEVPHTLTAIQQLLDNHQLLGQSHGLAILSADEVIIPGPSLYLLQPRERNAYLWEKDIYPREDAVPDWDIPYQQIRCANAALNILPQLKTDNRPLRTSLEGAAHFSRAHACYNLVQLFAKPYDSAEACCVPGIPVPQETSIHTPVRRLPLQEVYACIIEDLHRAARLLPPLPQMLYPNRPSAVAAYALLSRVYLGMRQYEKAAAFADSCLLRYDTLIDFNTLDTTAKQPFPAGNPEVLYQSEMLNNYYLLGIGMQIGLSQIDSVLYRSYAPDDLRRVLFYKTNEQEQPQLKSSYSGNNFPFTGIALDELYLIRAECYARANNTAAAMEWLNKLLIKRYRQNYFVPMEAHDPEEALQLILAERSKELVLRGLRWADLRRLNIENFGITLRRFAEGKEYILPPNSTRYVMPIPDYEIWLTGMEQNQR
jgi:hypothetical protein